MYNHKFSKTKRFSTLNTTAMHEVLFGVTFNSESSLLKEQASIVSGGDLRCG